MGGGASEFLENSSGIVCYTGHLLCACTVWVNAVRFDGGLVYCPFQINDLNATQGRHCLDRAVEPADRTPNVVKLGQGSGGFRVHRRHTDKNLWCWFQCRKRVNQFQVVCHKLIFAQVPVELVGLRSNESSNRQHVSTHVSTSARQHWFWTLNQLFARAHR